MSDIAHGQFLLVLSSGRNQTGQVHFLPDSRNSLGNAALHLRALGATDPERGEAYRNLLTASLNDEGPHHHPPLPASAARLRPRRLPGDGGAKTQRFAGVMPAHRSGRR